MNKSDRSSLELAPSFVETFATLKKAIGVSGGEKTSLNEVQKAFLPAPDATHIFEKDFLQDLLVWWTYGGNCPLFVSGPAGAGKTSTMIQFAAHMGVPILSWTARSRMDKRDLIGHWEIKDGNTLWSPGPAYLAWKYGLVLLINEPTIAPAEVWVSCNDLLEGSSLYVEQTGETIERHPGARVVFTDNVRGASLEGSDGFYSRQLQDRSVMDRCWHLQLLGLSQEREAGLLVERLPDFLKELCASDVLHHLATQLVALADDTRTRSQQEKVGFSQNSVPLSYRSLERIFIAILSKVRVGLTDKSSASLSPVIITQAVKLGISTSLDNVHAELLERLAVTRLGNICERIGVSMVDKAKARRMIRALREQPVPPSKLI